MDVDKTMQRKLWQRIKQDNLKPKPFGYFALLILVISVCTLFFLAISIYLANLIGVLQQSHEYLRLLKHGSAGLWLLLPSLPIALIVGLCVLFFAVIILVRKFFGLYRFSLLRVVAGCALVVVLLTYLLIRFDTKLSFLRLFGIESTPLKTFHGHYFNGQQGHIVHGDITEVNGNQIRVKLLGSNQETTMRTSSSTQGITVNQEMLPLAVFILISDSAQTPEVLYIGHPVGKK